MKPADLLIETGLLLYGESWMGPLAKDLGINRETVRQFANGRMRFPHDHPLMDRLVDLIHHRKIALEKLRMKILSLGNVVPLHPEKN